MPASGRCPLPNLSPQRKKERTQEALIRQLQGLVHEKPVVAIWEDAHWLDPTSRELLDPNFARAVVLMVQHTDEGAMGLVINRPSKITLAEAWKQVSEVTCPSTGFHFHGPVGFSGSGSATLYAS